MSLMTPWILFCKRTWKTSLKVWSDYTESCFELNRHIWPARRSKLSTEIRQLSSFVGGWGGTFEVWPAKGVEPEGGLGGLFGSHSRLFVRFQKESGSNTSDDDGCSANESARFVYQLLPLKLADKVIILMVQTTISQ